MVEFQNVSHSQKIVNRKFVKVKSGVTSKSIKYCKTRLHGSVPPSYHHDDHGGIKMCEQKYIFYVFLA